MIKTVLFLDTETTGLDPKTDQVIEIGLVRWSVEHCCVLECWSALVAAPNNAAESINKIPAGALSKALPYPLALNGLQYYVNNSDAIIAHNAEFDRSFLPELHKPWICSMSMIDWPEGKPGASLVDLALAHGVAVTDAHRALTDCLILSRLFEAVARRFASDGQWRVDVMLERALRPSAEFAALVDFKEKDKAKAAGFRWNPERKLWHRRMAIDDVENLPFRVRQLP